MVATRFSTHRKARRRRAVYIIAKPVKSAGTLSFLSDGKFPFCHWGLLVTRHSRTEIHALSLMMRLDLLDDEPWGTLFEINRNEANESVPNICPAFGAQELRGEWNRAFLIYVGSTSFSDDKLSREGICE
jgi:hypothetical protein